MRSNSAVHAANVRRLLSIVIRQPERVPALPAGELDLSLRLARRARVLGRLANALEVAGLLDALPPVAEDQLRSSLVMADARARMARWELDRIAWALGEDTTPLVAMKGCAYLLMDLPLARGRIFADVDLMTDEERLETLEAALGARGWKTAELTPYDENYYRKWTHELPPLTHAEREMEVDLHHNVLPRTARLKPDGRKLMERSRPLPDSRYRVLADEDIVLHAMTHLMFADDLADKLRELVDIADLVDFFASRDERFWERFVDRAPELDLTRPAWYALRHVRRLLDADVPEAVMQEQASWAPPAPVVSLMDQLIPRALYPKHPDLPFDRQSQAARLMLYVRSHWVRMPPWLLGYHLAYKAAARRLGLGKAGAHGKSDSADA
jgi:hypothetical protein